MSEQNLANGLASLVGALESEMKLPVATIVIARKPGEFASINFNLTDAGDPNGLRVIQKSQVNAWDEVAKAAGEQ